MKEFYKKTIWLVFFGLVFVVLFWLLSGQAQAAATVDVNLTGDPCTASDGGCTPGAVDVGVDTVTYSYVLDGADNVDFQFQLRYGADGTVGDQADTVVTDDAACSGGSDPIVLTAPTFDTSGITASACKTGTPTWVSASDWVDWDSSGTNCNSGDALVVTWNIEFCSEAAGNTYDIDNNCTKAGGAANCDGSIDYVDAWSVNAAAPATLEQVAYRWFENTDSVAVGRPTTINTPATAPAQGNPLRLRLLFHVADAQLDANGTTTKLQYAVRSGECDTAFSGEVWNDLDPSSGDIRYYVNTTPSDEDNLTASVFDPRHTTTSVDADMCNVVEQDYEEQNNFTNSVDAIPQDEDGLWDFAIYDYSAPPDTTYCFRAVQSGGGVLTGGYQVVPELTTAQVVRVRLRGNIRLRPVRLR